MAKAPIWSDAQVSCFLSELRRTGNVSASASSANVTRNSAYEKRQSDDEFKLAWASALETSLDDLEETLRRRALDGTDKPVFYGGEKIGDVKSYNDNLGIFLLKARRKKIFGEVNNSDESNSEVDPQTIRQLLINKLDAIEN